MFAKFEDGHVHYQDEFGRTEKQRDFLKKDPPIKPLRPDDVCSCGYGRSFKACCMLKPIANRLSLDLIEHYNLDKAGHKG